MTRLAVAGATGLVGTKMLETLDRKIFLSMSLYSSHQHAQLERKLNSKVKHIPFKN